jgi:hypothetical protein
VANLIGAIKWARYEELTGQDLILTVLTDSMELYHSRLRQMRAAQPSYGRTEAALAYERYIRGLSSDDLEELTRLGRKRIHNLKYYTWIEQQGKDLEELNAQWYDDEAYWGSVHRQADQIDGLIRQFNERTGLLKALGKKL